MNLVNIKTRFMPYITIYKFIPNLKDNIPKLNVAYINYLSVFTLIYVYRTLPLALSRIKVHRAKIIIDLKQYWPTNCQHYILILLMLAFALRPLILGKFFHDAFYLKTVCSFCCRIK